MFDRNGKEIKTGDVVEISGAYFKTDNGFYFVEQSPGNPYWSGSDHSLRKCSKKGKPSTAKYSVGFWPLMVTVSDRFKGVEARVNEAIENGEALPWFNTGLGPLVIEKEGH